MLSESFYVWLKKNLNKVLKVSHELYVSYKKSRRFQLQLYSVLAFVVSLTLFLLPSVFGFSSLSTSFYLVFCLPLSVILLLYSVFLLDQSSSFSEAKKATSHNIPKFTDDFRKVVCKNCKSQVYYDTIRVFGNKCPDCGSVLPITKKEVNTINKKEVS